MYLHLYFLSLSSIPLFLIQRISPVSLIFYSVLSSVSSFPLTSTSLSFFTTSLLHQSLSLSHLSPPTTLFYFLHIYLIFHPFLMIWQVSGAEDGSLRVWDIWTKQCIKEVKPMNKTAITNVVVSSDSTLYRMMQWDSDAL